jgi:Short repeat of unknown function (DUF308)
MFSSASSALLWRGLLAVAIGIVSVAWPNITVGAFVILFAVYAFIAAGSDTARAFSSDRAGPVAGYLFLALLSFAAGLVALLWPGLTALALWRSPSPSGRVRQPANGRCGPWEAWYRSRWAWYSRFDPISAHSHWQPCSGCSASSLGFPHSSCPHRHTAPAPSPQD